MLILLLNSRKKNLGQLFHDTLNVHSLRIWKGQTLFNSLSKVFIHIRNSWNVEGFGCYLFLCSGDISEGQKIWTMKCFFSMVPALSVSFSPERERDIGLKKFPGKKTCGIISQAVKEVRRKLKSDGMVRFLCQYGSEHCRLGSFPVFHRNDLPYRSSFIIFKACRQLSHSSRQLTFNDILIRVSLNCIWIVLYKWIILALNTTELCFVAW